MRSPSIVLLAAMCLAPSITAQTNLPRAAIDSVFQRFDRVDRPGCALGVMHDGELTYARGYGMANLDLGVAITPQSVFRTGSLSKQFTAGAIILLAADGTVSLDADIREYLPEMPAYDRPMTVRQFVNHTSGIRDYLTLMYLAGKRDQDFYTNHEVLEMVARQKEPNFLPGDEFLYSNSGYFLLGEIVRRASGTSLRRFSQDRIFQPLGMTHTHFHDDHTETVPQRASGYSERDDGTWRIDMTTLDMVGDGGVFTSIEDLLFWERQLLEPNVGGESWLQEMLRPGVLTNRDTLDYAGGLRVSSYRGLRTVDHGGAFVGFRSYGLRFPDQLVAIYVLCNFAQAAPGQYARAVADLILTDQFTSPRPSGGVADSDDQGAAASANLTANRVREIAGTFYSGELDVEYQIVPEDGGLRLTVGPQTVDLRAANDTTLSAGNGFVTLRLPRGRVDRFRLDAGRVKNLRFERR